MIKILAAFLIISGFNTFSLADSSNVQTTTSKAPVQEQIRDKQYQFLLKKIFKVTSQKIEKNIFSKQSKNKAKYKYLQDYQGQGRYVDNLEKPIALNQLISSRSTEDEYQSIRKHIKHNLKTRGYRNFSKKTPAVRRITDFKRTTNAFFETSLRDALNEVSQQVGIPFLMDETVQGTITLKLDNTPLDEALEMLLVSGGFDYVEKNNYIMIGFPQSNSPLFKRLSKTVVIHPVYLKPDEIANLLSTDYKDFVKTDDTNNTIVVTTTAELLDRIQRDIKAIDHRPAQVKLEVLIADISSSAKRKLGRDFWNDTARGRTNIFGSTVNLQSSTDSGFTFDIIEENSIDATSVGNKLGLTSLLKGSGLGLTDLGTTLPVVSFFTSAFNAMSNTGEARVWATPSVVASDGKTAVIDITSEQVIPIVSGPKDFLQVSTKDYTSGVKMEIVPRISSNGEISLDIVEIEVGTVSFTGERQSTGDPLPVLTKRKISTIVALNNQETLIIGGLLDIQHDESKKNFPGIPDGSPLIGTNTEARESRDLMIFITPTLLEEHSKKKKVEKFL
jgi:type II secretory pathway component GspD/PulD (secretin)